MNNVMTINLNAPIRVIILNEFSTLLASAKSGGFMSRFAKLQQLYRIIVPVLSYWQFAAFAAVLNQRIAFYVRAKLGKHALFRIITPIERKVIAELIFSERTEYDKLQVIRCYCF